MGLENLGCQCQGRSKDDDELAAPKPSETKKQKDSFDEEDQEAIRRKLDRKSKSSWNVTSPKRNNSHRPSYEGSPGDERKHSKIKHREQRGHHKEDGRRKGSSKDRSGSYKRRKSKKVDPEESIVEFFMPSMKKDNEAKNRYHRR